MITSLLTPIKICASIVFGEKLGLIIMIYRKGADFHRNRNDTPMKKKTTVSPFPSTEDLRNSRAAEGISPARAALNSLFDDSTFVELGAYTKRSYHDGALVGKDTEFEGVITGYGAVNGQLVFAFAQDETRMKGAIDARHASKIEALYDLAIKKGAPVVGMFSSAGADIYEGVAAMSAYGRILKTVTEASDEILQIAYVRGLCIGTAAAIASAFDFVVAKADAPFYVTSPELGGHVAEAGAWCFKGDDSTSLAFIRSLLDFIPDSSINNESADDLNRLLPELPFSDNIRASLTALVDDGVLTEVYADYGSSIVTAFASVGGIKCGVVAGDYSQNNGRITRNAAYKTADFLDICDSFGLPVVTLVNSEGLASDIPMDAVRALAFAYAQLGVPGVTVLLDHAIGAAYTLMGSKSLGSELVYAIPTSEIGPMTAGASVAFALNQEITGAVTREALEESWRAEASSPVTAASLGEVDDLIPPTEIRARIASALLMLTC